MKKIIHLLQLGYKKLPLKLQPSFLRELYKKYKRKRAGKSVYAKISGINYHLDLSNNVESLIYDGIYESTETKLIKKLCPEF
jgi:hypothetical protein